MTDMTNPFDTMLKAGESWAKTINPALESFTPKGFEAMMPMMSKELMDSFWGKGMNPDGLDTRTRLLLTIMGLTVQGAPMQGEAGEVQLRITVRHAVEAGATKQEIAETIAQAGLFAGLPAMSRAMELATEAMKEDET